MGKGLSKSKTIMVVGGVVIAIVVGVIAFFSVGALMASGDNPIPSYIQKDMNKVLGSSENPYTILEIVPDTDSGALGYLVTGQEPQNLRAIGSTDINNPDSAASLYKNAFASETSPSAIVGDRVNAYTFEGDKNSIGTTPVSGFDEKKDQYISETQPGSDMAYSEFGYYTKVAIGEGQYNYSPLKKCFVPEAGGNFSWTSLGEFQYVGVGQAPQGSITCSRMLDSDQDGERGYSYNYSKSGETTGAVGKNAYKYYYSPAGDFVWVPNSYYNSEDIFGENVTQEDIQAANVGDRLYMTRTENIYYVYKSSMIMCNDIPIKFLVGPEATAQTFKTQIVTVTPKQLKVDDYSSEEAEKAMDLIDTSDAIYIHDSAIGYKIAGALSDKVYTDEDAPDFDKKSSGDISLKTANYIISRGAQGVTKDVYGQVTRGPAAIIFDEEAIDSANSYVKTDGITPDDDRNCSNLKLIYDVYNNLGAKLAYNWMQNGSSDYDKQDYGAKLLAAKAEQGYRDFDSSMQHGEIDALGRSQFVYNYTGEDDSWLTTDFANESKIVKTDLNAPAFTDVNTFINADCGQSMSVAKMFMAINLEADAYNQPEHLRILEIEPNEKYMYDANNKDSWVKYYLDLIPWYVGTSDNISDNVTVTSMPTYEFISKNEDVNENYDMIIIGNKEQDETNGAQGYNDANLNVNWNGETKGFAYTAVGDLITTFGGDEIADQTIEDNRTDVEEDWGNDYTWNYGIFSGNRWYNAWNAPHLGYKNDETLVYRDGWQIWTKKWETYRFGFQRKMIMQIVGEGKAMGWGGQRWWYQKDKNFVYATKHGSDANMVGLRYAGNDLSKKKYDQLIDFSTQAPLIVDDNLYWPEDTVWRDYANEISLDRSSFVYKLANKNTEEDTTVYKHARGTEANGKLNAIKTNLTSYTCYADFTPTTSGKEAMPHEYSEGEAINYNQQTNSSGNNVLEYHFVLNGDKNTDYGVNVYTDSNGNGIFEGCINHLKEREINGDNSSFDNERASNLNIFDETEKRQVYDGVLEPGHTYLVTRVLPDSELGMVPWKLEIYKQGNESVRFSENGYTRIKPRDTSQVKEIKVLQMNLTPDMTKEGSNSINFANNYWYTVDYDWRGNFQALNAMMLTDNNKTDFQREMSQLLKVDDFNIKVDYMDNVYWKVAYGSDAEKWEKALMEYDMLMIGFQDVANFTNDEVYIEGFEKFREAGKSIILSHDLCQDASIGIASNSDNWNGSSIILSDVRYYLRDISGQIRKYYNAADYNDKLGGNDYSYFDYYSNGEKQTFEPSDNFKIYTSIYEEVKLDHNLDYIMQNPDDIAHTPIYNKYTYTLGVFDDDNYTVDRTQGNGAGILVTMPVQAIRNYYANQEHKPAGLIMDNSVRAMLYYSGANYTNYQYSDKIDRFVNRSRDDLIWQTKTFATTKVQSVNEGQITKYPYAIPQSIDVAQTHAQNYQLDLEYDSDGDVLVWYNLAGNGKNSIYDGRNQDSRNNFYIYTKGNVTYTGLGHSGSMSDMEKKLFVNTMVASYRSGAAEPYITVTNPDAVTNGKETTLYLEDRDYAGTDTAITYRIDDDTTNSKIDRSYQLIIYKDDNYYDNIYPAQNSGDNPAGYSIPVSYSDVKTNGQVKYTILLNSSYRNDKGVEVLTTDTYNITVALMPMFDLR